MGEKTSQVEPVNVLPDADREAMEKHRVPAIDRMMDVLSHLERRSNGASIRELVEFLHLPRTTIYRIVNSLHSYDLVKRTPQGNYILGPRLLSLAARVLPGASDIDLVSFAMPHLERLSEATGEASKVSILDGDGVLVIAAVPGTREYALSVVPGQRPPIHAGAASKVLLAGLTKTELDAVLPAVLPRYTSQTTTNRKQLDQELTRIRRQGWAYDEGEYATGVNAFAARIPDREGRTIAALSVPFLAGADKPRLEQLRAAAISTAGAIAADIPARPTASARKSESIFGEHDA